MHMMTREIIPDVSDIAIFVLKSRMVSVSASAN